MVSEKEIKMYATLGLLESYIPGISDEFKDNAQTHFGKVLDERIAIRAQRTQQEQESHGVIRICFSEFLNMWSVEPGTTIIRTLKEEFEPGEMEQIIVSNIESQLQDLSMGPEEVSEIVENLPTDKRPTAKAILSAYVA